MRRDSRKHLNGLSILDRALKRTFDVVLAMLGLAILGWLIILAYVASTIDTRRSGIFVQNRVGRRGVHFPLIKIRTMRDIRGGVATSVTTSADPRITPLGKFLRRAKIDELPQLLNVLAGHMSFVGPRPDVSGFADTLKGPDRIILSVRPGITGPATLKYRNEEEVLAKQTDPERFNREVIFPDKVRLNRDYIENYRFGSDLRYLWQTVFARGREP